MRRGAKSEEYLACASLSGRPFVWRQRHREEHEELGVPMERLVAGHGLPSRRLTVEVLKLIALTLPSNY